MKKALIMGLAGWAMVLAAPVAAQGLAHTWLMRGQVVHVQRDAAVICIGRADGARTGQVLDVYRVRQLPGSPRSTVPNFRRERVGAVTINAIVDDHFARVEITEGRVARNDIVELRPNQPVTP